MTVGRFVDDRDLARIWLACFEIPAYKHGKRHMGRALRDSEGFRCEHASGRMRGA